jgi:flagellum-specific peptidoglycan hydrolase FlgJ
MASVLLPFSQGTVAYAREITSDTVQMTASDTGQSSQANQDSNQGPSQASTAPARVTPTSRGGDRPTPDISTHDKFIAAVAEVAQESQLDSGVPASVTIAQAILESDWGQSLLATKGQNYFGIKASKGPGPAGEISMSTWEVISGANVTVSDAFKAYHNLYESVMDHGRFLADNARYAAAFKVTNDPKEFARRIQAAGYATDPSYATKLINLMDKFNLYQYDLPQSGQ